MPESKEVIAARRAAYRARCIAEKRCGNCARVRDPGDTETVTCAHCRATKNRGEARRYAAARVENPPHLAFIQADPAKPFRYGKTRLKSPRRVTVKLDRNTFQALDALRVHFPLSPHYEPYLVSDLVRRLLRTVGEDDLSDVIYRGKMQSGEGVMSLCFMCDADNYARIDQQRARCHCTVPAAVRDLIYFAARRVLYEFPDADAKKLLWEPETGDESMTTGEGMPLSHQ